jgi:hypothetical protein
MILTAFGNCSLTPFAQAILVAGSYTEFDSKIAGAFSVMVELKYC